MQAEKVTAYLLLGSNLGDRDHFLTEALREIESKAGEILDVSSVYETEPWGVTGQSAYLNQVAKLYTDLTPDLLLKCLLEIEAGFGRVRQEVWGSRTIDIDILYYGSLILESRDLQIPHPRLHMRNFVLYPLDEIAPDEIHPVFLKTNRVLLQDSTDSSAVNRRPGGQLQ